MSLLLGALFGILATAAGNVHLDLKIEIPEGGIEHLERGLLHNPGKYKTPKDELLRGRSLLPNGGLEVSKPLLADYFGGKPGFYHGVASGDPLPNAVVIWTRYTPVKATDEVTLEFRIAPNDSSIPKANLLNPAANPSLRRGTVVVQGSSDWIAKIDVTGLAKNTNYVFVFTDGNIASEIGQTRTAPGENDPVSDLRFAFFSCTHMNNGYFHSYDVASTITDLDFWSHLGDYYYEYGTYYQFSVESAERGPLIMPPWETVSLQDYRLRLASYIHNDVGHRNLRRRAPFWGTWDDHETANNVWGNSSATGAENHQTVCPVGPNATDAAKAANQCDQDEGSAVLRSNSAYQAYMEWLPRRWQAGTMGVITLGNFNEVIEWGNLATLVSVDTRHSFRSEDPTVDSNAIAAFVPFATQYKNVSAYTDPKSAEYAILQQIVAKQKAINANPSFHQVGDYIQFIENAFRASKNAGKPWQVWAANTMMGPNVLPDLSSLHKVVPPALAPVVKIYSDAVLRASATIRAVVAVSVNNIEHNRDDFGGFGYERAQLINVFKRAANNAIVWGGDLHDSFAWVLYDGGNITGTPVAVNIGGPGVTSDGFDTLLLPAYGGLAQYLPNGINGIYDIIDAAYLAHDPGLRFHNFKQKGFVVGHATRNRIIHEYFGFEKKVTLTSYANITSGGSLTAPSVCLSHLETAAGQPGSLIPSSTCSDTKFDTARPDAWSLPVPRRSNAATGRSLRDCGYKGCVFNCQTFTVDDTPLSPGGTVNLPANIIRYITCANGIASVRFTLDRSVISIDSGAPYRLRVSNLKPGTHSLLVEVFAGRMGRGKLIEWQQITFVVEN